MRIGLGLAFVALAGMSVVARADTMDPTTGSGGGVSGSGTLTTGTTPNAQGGYTITAISGDSSGVTGLLPYGALSNDNLLFPDGPQLVDGNGFAFTDTMGDTNYSVDLFYSAADGSYEAEIVDSDHFAQEVPATFSLGSASTEASRRVYSFALAGGSAVTPEPASFALMGTGLLGLAALMRRRRRMA